MSENINNTGTAKTVENPNGKEVAGKTFTQEEVNRIVSDRLGRERDKKAAELDEREKAVKARELAVIAAEKLAAAGLPKDLAAVLKYDDESSLDAAVSQLSELRGFKDGNGTRPEGDKKKIIEYKLPEPSEYDNGDSMIRNAFRLSRE